MAQCDSAIAALRKLLGPNLLCDRESMRPFECDGLSAYRVVPMLVALPKDELEVGRILQICSQYRLPVVSRGAGTGLSGGAMPHSQGLLLVLSRMNRILDIDLVSCQARVEPGVTNLSISHAVKEHGLFFAPDPSSQIACSIGGNVAENSGGVHCLKYGLTLNNITGLVYYSACGERIKLTENDLGYDLLTVLTGSEGLLGVITEITVKLIPLPETRQVIMAGFSDVQDAADAVAAIISEGVIPAGMEMMDKLAIKAAEAFSRAGYPTKAQALLICEIDGAGDEVSKELQITMELLAQFNPSSVHLARDEAECNRFWAGRKNAFPAVGRLAPDYYCIDCTIPRRCVGGVLLEISRLADEEELRVANVFHAGDGNLHPLILYDNSIPGALEKTERLGSKIMQLCIAAGGTITGEHGVGIEKIGEMCCQFSAQELAQMRELKRAFDPQELLNPGKAIPTLARCADFKAMHVHHGKLSFPDLPRF